MAEAKTERLLNLVICLLATRRYLTREQIRAAVPGYAESNEAFERTFERDKEELRELGIPLETGSNDALFDDELGYRIDRGRYELPEIELEPDEAAVLGLAARAWQQASLAQAATGALLKLKAAGVDTDAQRLDGIEPRMRADEPAFESVLNAVRDGRPVSFDYRRGGAAEASARRLEPWGVVSWHGRWYVVGHDLDRAATRVFRLDRVVGEVRFTGPAGSVTVPDGVSLRDQVARLGEGSPSGTAHLLVRQGTGDGLRRRGAPGQPRSEEREGWDAVDVPYAHPESLGEEVAGYGADVVVIDPPEVREALVRRLGAVADADAGA